LFNRVDRIAAGIRQRDDLGAGSLSLQQERGEVAGAERADRAENLTSTSNYRFARLLLKIMPEA